MTVSIKQQLALLVDEWRSGSQRRFSARADQFERGYRAGFARALETCSTQLEAVLAQYGADHADET